ncbi:MAG: hypothetical protein ACE5K9_11540 [Candidatus Methylomirabilales bacterium]
MRLWHVVATFLILALLYSVPEGADARQWRMTPSAQAQEYSQIIDQRANNEVVLVWWVAPEVIEDDSPGTEEARAILRQYMLVGVAHAQISPLGQFKFQRPRGLRVQLPDASGKRPMKGKRPMSKKSLPPAVAGVVSVLETTFSQAMGEFGRGVHWYVFDGRDISSCGNGAFWITYAGEQYSYKTPIPGCTQRAALPKNGPTPTRMGR